MTRALRTLEADALRAAAAAVTAMLDGDHAASAEVISGYGDPRHLAASGVGLTALVLREWVGRGAAPAAWQVIAQRLCSDIARDEMPS